MSEATQALVKQSVALAPTLYEGNRDMNALDVVHQVRTVQEVMEAVMKPDIHYGKIAGCDKPSLLQPGAEKLAMTFRLAIKPVVEDLSQNGEAHFRVTAEITHIPTGRYVGTGIGECSTLEEKYAWKKAVCHAEYEYTEKRKGPDYVRTKFGLKRQGTYKKGEDNYYTIEQIRANPADLRNTILQMAIKRAVVSGVKRATAASDVFAQNLEDLPEDYRQMVMEEEMSQEPVIQAPQRKSTPQSTTEVPAQAQAANAPQQTATQNGNEKLIAAFAALKVTSEQLAEYVGASVLTAEDVDELRKVYSILKAGEMTWAELLQMKNEQRGITAEPESAPLEGEVLPPAEEEPVIDEKQRARMYAVMAKSRPKSMKSSDWEKVGRHWIFDTYKIDSTAKVRVKDLDSIIAHFEALAAPESGEQA